MGGGQAAQASGQVLPRPRLLSRLNGAAGPLIVLRAGAGYGKSVLAEQWAGARRSVSWLEGDASASIERGWGDGDLVLDSYAPGSAEVDALTEQLLRICPPERRLLLLTRAEPSFDLPRLALEGEACELGVDALAFNTDEIQRLLHAFAGVEPSEELLSRLMERTLGWPAALRLALENLQADGGIERLAGELSPVSDYIESVIWRPLIPVERQFALATAVLEELRPEWCDELTGRQGSATVLRRLRASESWLIPPRRLGQGYRFHPLVREFLLTRLDEEPAWRREQEKRAARLLQRAGRLLEASEHATLASDWELAIELLRAAADRAFREGEGGRLRSLLGRFPKRFRERSELQRIEGYLSWAGGDLQVAIAKAERAARTSDPDLQADALILKAAVHYAQGDFESEQRALEAALAGEEVDRKVMGKAWFGLGSLHFRAGRIAEAEKALKRAAALTHDGEAVHVGVLGVLALLPLSKGTPQAALPALSRAIEANRSIGNRRGEAHACYHQAIALNQAGMHLRALDALADADQLAEALGLAHLGALVARETADAHRDLRSSETPALYRASIAELEALDASAGLLHAYHGLAVHQRRLGEAESARRAATRALEYSDSGDSAFVALARLHQAVLSEDARGAEERLGAVMNHSHRYYQALALLYATAVAERDLAAELGRRALEIIRDQGFEHLLGEERELVESAPGVGRKTLVRLRGERQRYRFRLLGGLELTGGDGKPVRLRPQALELLAFVALRRGATVEPLQLIDALWPGCGLEKRSALQTLVWLVRDTVDERVVVTRRKGYAFDPDGKVWLDVDEFARELQHGRFEECVALYRGELLPGVSWADLERRQLENQYLRALEDLAEQCFELGQHERGVALLEQVIATDPLAEEAYRKLIAFHRRAGREGVAHRLQRQLVFQIEHELDLPGS